MTSNPAALYLDVCTLCRPFDDQEQPRIRRETESYYRILQAIQEGCYTLVYSPVHWTEIGAIADPLERNEIKAILVQQGTPGADNDLKALRRRAETLTTQGMGTADAAHVAFAEVSAAFFITCDDRLVKQCNRLGVNIQAIKPTAFCEREKLKI